MFEKLDVYQKAVDFAEQVSALTETFPKGTYYLSDQLNRAALSISANLAEGNGRWHKNERKEFFWIARGSAQECVPIIEICKRRKFLTVETHKTLKDQLEVMAKMFTKLISGLEERGES